MHGDIFVNLECWTMNSAEALFSPDALWGDLIYLIDMSPGSVIRS